MKIISMLVGNCNFEDMETCLDYAEETLGVGFGGKSFTFKDNL